MKKLLLLIILLIGIYFGYTHFINKTPEPGKFIYEDILNKVGENKTNINSFTIYGKYLNLKGDLPTESGSYNLVLKNNEDEIILKTLTD